MQVAFLVWAGVQLQIIPGLPEAQPPSVIIPAASKVSLPSVPWVTQILDRVSVSSFKKRGFPVLSQDFLIKTDIQNITEGYERASQ